ncbi:unnamed protein product [Lymnaea stagnalis]|uniref:PH domain-containing protein n=1 Tax=Lymnaea stagnalis TaxID=6523 RepID=A0AAV2HCI7_LYMST
MQSTLKKASTLPAQLLMTKSGVSAQDLIKLHKAVVKSGVLRKKSPSIIHKTWPRRFVILLHDSIYIYGDETSKSPNATLPLHGYKQVVRTCTAVHDWCFTLMPALDLATIKPKTFSCVSDQERCEWMMAIRNEIFSLNDFSKLGPVSEQQLRALSAGDPVLEAVYTSIEEPVPHTKISVLGDGSDSDDEFYDSSSNDGDSESFSSTDKLKQQARYKVSTKADKPSKLPHLYSPRPSPARPNDPPPKPSPTPPTDPPPKPSPTPPTDPPPKPTPTSRTDPSPKPLPALPTDPPPKSPLTNKRKKSASLPPTPAENVPPRYSTLVDDFPKDYVNVEGLDSDYEYPSDNLARSLEKQCTVLDDKSDRDDLVRMLQAKQASGTYLIRKSRHGDEKVIAYLTANGRVVEYKIHTSDSGVSLDKAKHFGDVEELLLNYMHQEPLPRSNNFLRYGFNIV